MKRKNGQKRPADSTEKASMEYPFGFGFALMSNPRAMTLFFSLNEEHQRDLMRTISGIESREEIRGFLEGIVQSIPNPTHRETP